MNRIDVIYYINLDHRIDRRKEVEKQLVNIGFDPDKIVRMDAIRKSVKGLGCGLSHMECLQKAMVDNLDNVMVVEDDFTFRIDQETLHARLQHAFSVEFDAYILGGKILQSKQESSGIQKVEEAQALSCYIVSKKFIPVLHDNFQLAMTHLERGGRYDEFAIDQFSKPLQKSNVYFCHLPTAGIQAPGWSDIEQTNVCYGC